MDAPLHHPLPGTYSVAQLDVDATVKALDTEAQEAARTIKPAQCLIYLYRALEFPSPNRPWTRFAAYLVGPGLRAEDSENCFTADMCVPIFPNTAHPDRRAPVRTTPTFPFSNCSHWAYVDVLLRVSNGDFPSADSSDVIRLPEGQQAVLDTLLTEELTAAVQAKRVRNATRDGAADTGGGHEGTGQSQEDSEEIFVYLAGTLDRNNLPDPMEFLRQSNALVRIVKHSATWKKTLAEQPPSDDDFASISTVSIVFSDETSLSDEDRHEAAPRAKGLQRLSQAIRRILGRVDSGDPEEDDNISRHFFDQGSDIDATKPLPKQPKGLPSPWKSFGFVAFLRSRSTSAKHSHW